MDSVYIAPMALLRVTSAKSKASRLGCTRLLALLVLTRCGTRAAPHPPRRAYTRTHARVFRVLGQLPLSPFSLDVDTFAAVLGVAGTRPL